MTVDRVMLPPKERGLAGNESEVHVRTSEYVTVRDGTRLAIDIIRPARNGVPIETELPVVLQATPYQRALVDDGKIVHAADMENRDHMGRIGRRHMGSLLRHEYVIASLDIRGRGASFGRASSGETGSDQDRTDLYDVIEWLAVQPWCSGAVGMAGCSYVARTIFWAAATLPPHLKAVAPASVPLDNYETSFRPGGVKQRGYHRGWDQMMEAFASMGVPVDEDSDGSMLREAILEHEKHWAENGSQAGEQRRRPWRDTQNNPPDPVAMEWNYATNFAIGRSPVLHIGGWRDLFVQDSIRWRQLLDTMGISQRLIVGPWYHCVWYGDQTIGDAHVEWFDRYLKGIDNEVDAQPPIRYYVMGAPSGQEWRDAAAWPLPEAEDITYFLGPPGIDLDVSVNGGTLLTTAPSDPTGEDHYQVDYQVTTDEVLNTRWNIPPFGTEPKLDTRPIDRRSLTYTTEPFAGAIEFTGTPVVSFWVRSTRPDVDTYAYLSVVDPDGRTTLMTDGVLRASNRLLRTPPWPNDGLPWHGSFFADYAPLVVGEPALLEYALYPISFHVAAGQRVRLTINNFDRDMFDTPVESTPPTVSLLRDQGHPSAIRLQAVAAPDQGSQADD